MSASSAAACSGSTNSRRLDRSARAASSRRVWGGKVATQAYLVRRPGSSAETMLGISSVLRRDDPASSVGRAPETPARQGRRVEETEAGPGGALRRSPGTSRRPGASLERWRGGATLQSAGGSSANICHGRRRRASSVTPNPYKEVGWVGGYDLIYWVASVGMSRRGGADRQVFAVRHALRTTMHPTVPLETYPSQEQE